MQSQGQGIKLTLSEKLTCRLSTLDPSEFSLSKRSSWYFKYPKYEISGSRVKVYILGKIDLDTLNGLLWWIFMLKMNSWHFSSPIRVISWPSNIVENFRKIDLETINLSSEQFFVSGFVFQRLENPQVNLTHFYLHRKILYFLTILPHSLKEANQLVLIKKSRSAYLKSPVHLFSDSWRLHEQNPKVGGTKNWKSVKVAV